MRRKENKGEERKGKEDRERKGNGKEKERKRKGGGKEEARMRKGGGREEGKSGLNAHGPSAATPRDTAGHFRDTTGHFWDTLGHRGLNTQVRQVAKVCNIR